MILVPEVRQDWVAAKVCLCREWVGQCDGAEQLLAMTVTRRKRRCVVSVGSPSQEWTEVALRLSEVEQSESE